MKYIDFIELPPNKNQRIFIGNVLKQYNVLDVNLKATYLEAKKVSSSMHYYVIYSTRAFYSGYSATPRCIVKAQSFEVAVRIAKATGHVEPDASIDHDYADMPRADLHNPTNLPVIELKWD